MAATQFFKSVVLLLLLLATTFSLFSQEEERLSFAEIKEASVFYEKGEELYDQGKYAEAAENFGKAHSIIKSNKKAAYKAACAYAMANDKANSIAYMNKAMQAGYYDFQGKDCFKNISATPEFRQMIEVASMLKKDLEEKYIEPIVHFPPGYSKDKKHPLILVFHGFSDNPKTFIENYKATANDLGAVVMAFRGTKPLGNDLYAWNFEFEEYQRIYDDFQEALLKYGIDKSKVIVSGFWQGGLMAYAMGITFSGDFCGILPISGTMPQGGLSIEKMENKNIKIFSAVGERDGEEIIEDNKKAKSEFTAHNIAYKLNMYDIHHSFPPNKEAVLKEAFNWFMQ